MWHTQDYLVNSQSPSTRREYKINVVVIRKRREKKKDINRATIELQIMFFKENKMLYGLKKHHLVLKIFYSFMFSWISCPFLELVFLYWLIFYNKTIVYYSKEKKT